MKPVLMFTMESCPHCKRAHLWMEELQQEHPEYANLEITIIDETIHPEIARNYDYYYVPTYFVDKVKIHEGVPTKEAIRNVFAAAYA